MKKCLIPFVAILLALATLLTSCAPALSNISEKHYDKTEAFGNGYTENNSTESNYIIGVEDKTALDDDFQFLSLSYGDYRESFLPVDTMENDEPVVLHDAEEDLYSFIISCIAFDITRLGYTVSDGIATDDDGNSYIGLVFSDEHSTYSDGETEMPAAGFLQLVDEHTECVLSEETVTNGVVAVVGEDDTYLVNQYVSLNPFSGIFDGCYFKYCQVSAYAMSVFTAPVDDAVFDYGVDCYDFDSGRTKWKADPSVRPTLQAYSLYSDEAKAYQAACDAIRQLIDIQEQNAYRGEKTVMIVIDPAILDALALHKTPEMINEYAMEAIRGIELKENQFVVVSATEGVQIYTLPDVQEAIAQRRSNGLMQILTSSLMLVGSVVIACCSFGAGTPLVVTSVAVIAGGVASAYAVSNLIEGIDNVKLANCGDIYSPAMNPIRNQFVEHFGDDRGVLIYNAVGLGAMFIQSLTVPIGAGFKLANTIGAGVFQTTVIVGRAVLVRLCEMAVVGAVSTAAAMGTSYLVEKWTDNKIAADWSGLAAGLFTGFATMKGLNALDKRWNFSGLYTKQDVLQKYYIENQEKALNKFKPETWEKLSESAQKSAINRLSKFIAKDIGLADKTPKINYYNDPSDDAGYGFFRESDYSININKAYWNDSAELVDTLAHELQHAQQWQLVKAGVVNDVTSSYLNYITPEENWTAYRRQACEDQAFATGEAWKNFATDCWKPQTDPNTYYNFDGLKNMNYMNKRGWTLDKIDMAVQNGRAGISTNKATGGSCSVYCYPGTQFYVVIDDVTHSIVQFSQFGDTTWVPDNQIIWQSLGR